VLNLQTRINRVPVEKILESQGKNPPVKGLVTLTSTSPAAATASRR
jgi:AsmA protein